MRRIIGLLVILGLGGLSSYFIFAKTNISSYSFPDMRTAGMSGVGPAEKVFRGGAGSVVNLLSGIAKAAKEKGQEIADKVEDKIKEQAFKIFKDTIDKKIETVGESLGVDIKQVTKPDSESPVVFGVKTGVPAYFSIQNREKEDLKYEVDWRDGVRDGGRLEKGKEEVLSHKWEKAGNYLLKFKIINSKGEKTYNISITIL